MAGSTPSTPLPYALQPTKRLLEIFSMKSLQEQIKVIVGKDKKEFVVPKTVLCHRSEFFTSATGESWESGRKKEVRLEDEDPNTFVIFLTWCYSGDLQNAPSLCESFPAAPGIAEKPWLRARWMKLIESWVLGDFLQAAVFQNAVADLMASDTIASRSGKYLAAASPWAVSEIWKTTRPGSAPRLITLDALILTIHKSTPLQETYGKGVYLQEFIADLCALGLKYCQKGEKPRYPSPDMICKYHIHTATAPVLASCNNMH